MLNFKEITFQVIDILEKQNIKHCLIGGIAVSLTVKERFTKDIDFTILLENKNASQNFLKTIQDNDHCKIHTTSFVSVPHIPDFIRIFWDDIPIDFLVANIDYQQKLIERAIVIQFDRRSLRVASAEDLFILKLLANRPNDRQDIEWILKTHSNLDKEYIKEWCVIWEISDRLKEYFQ